MDDAMRDLYQDVILQHNRHPKNKRTMPDATVTHDGFNPLCGDKVKVYLKIKSDTIVDVSFEGVGCAISTASTSLMTEGVKGRTKREAFALFEAFHALVTRGPDATTDDLGKLTVFQGVGEFPARVKCATLAWHTLKAALSGDKAPASTE